jgi:hypothetical protein
MNALATKNVTTVVTLSLTVWLGKNVEKTTAYK